MSRRREALSVMKVVALVDGEHYPPVTRWGLASARAQGYDVLAAVAVGGVEKLGSDRRLALDGTKVVARSSPREALEAALDEVRPEAVLDLSDEPVLTYETRMLLVAVALVRGLPYIGPDFRFEPPVTEARLALPTMAVIGTGKRTGKTAVAGHLARTCSLAGMRPVVVAMGRGGPAGPVTAGPDDVGLAALLGRVARGEHAASDYLEDALTAGVTTVGARRLGGGLAGRPFVTNVAEAATGAATGDHGLVILEGSGASLPTVPWDAGVIVVPASVPPQHLTGYLGPVRVLLSDLAVFTIQGAPNARAQNLSDLESHVRRLQPSVRVAVAELEPVPLSDVRGKDAFFATTAHEDVARLLARRLERVSGCRVVSMSPHLADRRRLEQDLSEAPAYDVLLTELKAAAVDVASRRATDRGAEVVFIDNRPRSVGGDGDLDDLLRETARLAVDRSGAAREAGEQ